MEKPQKQQKPKPKAKRRKTPFFFGNQTSEKETQPLHFLWKEEKEQVELPELSLSLGRWLMGFMEIS